jgi:hypothetical protein
MYPDNREGLISFVRRKRKLQRKFRNKFGCDGNFLSPRSYHEKIQYRKLWGNHPFYAMVADKFRVREYVAEKAGERYLIPLLGVYDHLTADVFDKLPDRFIIKANHGCKWNEIVWDKRKLDIEATIRQTFGQRNGEYHYSLIEPKIIIEELLVDGDGVPCDYSFHSYNSDKGFDYAIAVNRHDNGGAIHFDKHWNLLEGELMEEEKEKYMKTRNFDEMVDVAKALSSDFDFARIDLYNVDGKVYFGEITLTPAAGFMRTNQHRAEQLTQMWTLDADNTRLYRKPWSRRLQFWKH